MEIKRIKQPKFEIFPVSVASVLKICVEGSKRGIQLNCQS